MSLAIKVENLSKAYQLGEMGSGTLSRDFERWVAKIRGKENPLLKIDEVKNRSNKRNDDIVWSLKDINFEIEQGNTVGIIGRNGAGKSTLLKLLSRITSPTTGEINIKGRIASLLEVGTGFHPELTGRENIFLNGAILGMRKKEIQLKFNEIVDFSGVEKYIDTPVKRYSSGMYVRLAFAVAAHLESEILIVDEVLAVGDAEFQKKCIGKMNEVSQGEGRTVLFVSHNMTAINSLCRTAMYIRNGLMIESGYTNSIIEKYLSTENEVITNQQWKVNNNNDGVARILEARLINRNNDNVNVVRINEEVGIQFTYEVIRAGYQPIPNIHIYNVQGDNVLVSSESSDPLLSKTGLYKSVMWIPGNLLNDGRYLIGIAASTFIPEKVHFYEKEALIFNVIEDMDQRNSEYRGKMPGVIRPKLAWQTNQIN